MIGQIPSSRRSGRDDIPPIRLSADPPMRRLARMRLRTFGGLGIDTPEAMAPLGARRMALLALVASAGKRGEPGEGRRDSGARWATRPPGTTSRRTSIPLRRETGQDWITPAPKLCLNNGATSDIGDFLETVDAEAHERVVDLYTGTFLQDFSSPAPPNSSAGSRRSAPHLRRPPSLPD